MPYVYYLAVALGLAIFALSFVLPEPAVAMVFKVLAAVAFLVAFIFAIPGVVA